MSGKGCLRREPGACQWLLAFFTAALLAPAGAWGAATTRVEVRPEGSALAIAILSSDSRTLELESFSLDGPPRLVFDVPDAILAADQTPCFDLGAAGLRQLRVGQYQSDPAKVRIVLDLGFSPPPAWRVVQGRPGETIVSLGPRGPVALQPPAVKADGDTVLLRLAGAASLPRRQATLDDPPRIYADLTDAVLSASFRQDFSEGPVRELRMAQQAPACGHPVARLVVELPQPRSYILFSDGPDLLLAVGPEPWALTPPPYHAAARLRGKRIVVDPGHGGKDIGAPALPGPPPQPPFEKDIVLDIGIRLARLLQAEGAAVTMTREDDTYVSLQARAALANELKADAFVSLHCNSYRTPDTLRGTSVYYDHENSIELAKLVQEELISALGTDDKGIRSANFAVIRRTQGPGILVESAFINHEGDRLRLINPNFRERAARAILQGMIRFLSEAPTLSTPGE